MNKITKHEALALYGGEDNVEVFSIVVHKFSRGKLMFTFIEKDEEEHPVTSSSLFCCDGKFPSLVARNGYFDAKDQYGNIVHIDFGKISINEDPVDAAITTMDVVQKWILRYSK